MTKPIVFSDAPVTLVGGGAALAQDVAEAAALAPRCVAADGGLGTALRAGVAPEAVIGDFDSVTPADLAQVPAAAQHWVAEQDTTDFEKALARIEAPLVIGVGFLGGRVDHQLAAFHALLAEPGPPCVLLGADELVFHCPAKLEVPCAPGDILSLFPLRAVAGRSDGLEWPIEGLCFAPGVRIGTSNRALGPVALEMDGPGMIGIVPRARLSALIPALRRAQPHGPHSAL